jgi:hypothetical protein
MGKGDRGWKVVVFCCVRLRGVREFVRRLRGGRGEGGRDADKYVVWFGDQGWRQGTGKGLGIQGEYFGIVSYDIAQKETSPAKLQRKHPITQPSYLPLPTPLPIPSLLHSWKSETNAPSTMLDRAMCEDRDCEGGCWGWWRCWGGGE